MRRGIITLLLALLFYGGLLWGALVWKKAPIEADVLTRSKAALTKIEGMPKGVFAEVSGRDVTLSGMVEDKALLADAESAVAAVHGVRSVDNKIAFNVEMQPARFGVEQIDDGRWAVDGRVAKRTVASSLEAAVREALPGGAELEGSLQVDVHTYPAPWSDAVVGWMKEQPQWLSRSGGMLIMEGDVVLAGEVYSESGQQALLENARARFEALDLELVAELDLVDPPLESELAILRDSNRLEVVGRLRDPQLKERLVEILKNSDGSAVDAEQLDTGDHIAPAPWTNGLARVLPGLVVEVEDLQLGISENTFLVSGSVSEQAIKISLMEMLLQGLEGTDLEVEDQLTVKAPPGPASLSIARGKDGSLRLGGNLPGPSVGRSFIEAAQAAAGEDTKLMSGIAHGENVGPAPWIEPMTGIAGPFVDMVSWGALTVRGNSVAIEAEANDANSADLLTALITESFPEDQFTRVMKISVAEPKGPTEQEIAAVKKVVDETVIYFASASANLSDGDRARLAELQAAFEKVPGSSLALIGHADPRGNAEYNRKLSRQRCEAVRGALEKLGVDYLLMEIEERGEVSDTRSEKKYKSGRRVEFELR